MRKVTINHREGAHRVRAYCPDSRMTLERMKNLMYDEMPSLAPLNLRGF